MLISIIDLYKEEYSFKQFYENLLYNIKSFPSEHIDNPNFLMGYTSSFTPNHEIKWLPTVAGDIRVDLPIWFGNPNVEKRIAIFGLEPRDSWKNGILNVERAGNYVFATPFALERPYSKYYKTFSEFLNNPNLLVYFSDVVKTYHVESLTDKRSDDLAARKNFKSFVQAGKKCLIKELELLNPSVIIGLGNESYQALSDGLDNLFKSMLVKLRHPSYGGSNQTKTGMRDIIEKL